MRHSPAAPRAHAARRLVLAAAASLVACGGESRPAGDSAAAAGSAAVPAADGDPTRRVAGGGALPAGFQARTDAGGTAGADLADVRYDVAAGAAAGSALLWTVRTGPAHVLWNPRDSASGAYTARARIEQREAPRHPEAFGMFVGGQGLDGDQPRYTYFVVRGTGEYLVRVREGSATRDVQPWTAAAPVAKADGSGRAAYDLAVRVGADSVRFLVGGQAVHAVAAGSVPTDGVVGLRVNHNLHLGARPVTLER